MGSSSKKRTDVSGPLQEDGGTASGVANAKKRVYLINDDHAVQDAIETMLKQAGYNVQTYPSPARFAEDSQLLIPGVVVMDQAIRQIVQVILVTALPRTSLGVAPENVAAVTVLEKGFRSRDLIEAVEDGFRQLQGNENQKHSLPSDEPEKGSCLTQLSVREREVIHQVYLGETNKAIGIQLGISAKTIEKHRSSAMKKLKVTSVASLVRLIDRD